MLRDVTGGRVLLFLLGNIILALGITLNTKTQLGVSTIISVPYCLGQLTHINLGFLIFCFYIIHILLQWVLLGKAFEKWQFLQIITSLVVSALVAWLDAFLPVAQQLPDQLLLLFTAVVLTGIGAALSVGMQLIPNPADAIAAVVGKKLRRDFGFGKNIFDFTCVLLTLTLGFLGGGRIIGIGLGTLCSMLFTGRVIALCTKPVLSVYRHVTR